MFTTSHPYQHFLYKNGLSHLFTNLLANSKINKLRKANDSKHSYDILGAGMLWKPKDLHKFVKIHQNLLKFVKIRQKFVKIHTEECYDKVLNEEF